MHISEGILSFPVIVGGYTLTAIGVGIGLKHLKDKDVVKTAVFASAFFVASLVHIPLGPSNIHLVLNGLIGLLLGSSCFCAIFVALILQAILFQFGGLTSLGINTFIMAFPAFICYLVFFKFLKNKDVLLPLVGFLTGFLSVFLSAMLLYLSLVLSGEHFEASAKLIFISHIPLMIIDGVVTAIALQFMKKVKPEMLFI